jgi:hypothetical protein
MRDNVATVTRTASPAALLYDHPRSRHLHAEQRAASKTAAADAPARVMPPIRSDQSHASAAGRRGGATITTVAQLRARHSVERASLAAKHRGDVRALEADQERRRDAAPQLTADHARWAWTHSEWLARQTLAARHEDARRRQQERQRRELGSIIGRGGPRAR